MGSVGLERFHVTKRWTKERRFAHWIDARSWEGWNNWKEKSVGSQALWPFGRLTANYSGVEMKGPHAMRSILDETISGETARIFTLWNLLPARIDRKFDGNRESSPFLENYTASYIGSGEKVKRPLCFREIFIFSFNRENLKSYNSIEGTKREKYSELWMRGNTKLIVNWDW